MQTLIMIVDNGINGRANEKHGSGDSMYYDDL